MLVVPSISPFRLRRHARFNFGRKGSTVKGQTIAFRLFGVERPEEKLGKETKSFGCQNKKLFARNKMLGSFLFWRDFNFLGVSWEKAFSVSRDQSLSGIFWSASRMVNLINYQKRLSSEKVRLVKWTLETDNIPFLSFPRAFHNKLLVRVIRWLSFSTKIALCCLKGDDSTKKSYQSELSGNNPLLLKSASYQV